jgi:LysM repeat protein
VLKIMIEIWFGKLYTEHGTVGCNTYKKEVTRMAGKRFIQVSLILILLAASFATTVSAKAWSACGSTYVVQRGDWLAKIARTCGVSLADLYAANPWTRYYYYIYPGQVLTLPGVWVDHNHSGPIACGPGMDAYGSYYVVCRGDTLGGIALYYGTTVRYLQQRNGIANANLIYAGQLIRPY